MISVRKMPGVNIDRVEIDYESLRLVLIDERFKRGITDYTHAYFDLRQLHGIQIIDQSPNSERRSEPTSERSNNDRDDSVVTGALVGGLLDAASGDDSVLDGVVLGGLVGGLSGGSTAGICRITLKQRSTHPVNLLFKNGESCQVTVNASGMADLARAWHKITLTYPEVAVAEHMGNQALSVDQLKVAQAFNHERYLADHHVLSETLFALALFAIPFSLLVGSAVFIFLLPTPYATTVTYIALVGLAIGLLAGLIGWTRKQHELATIEQPTALSARHSSFTGDRYGLD